MIDAVDELIKQIQSNGHVSDAYFTSSMLNDVGDIFERDGFGTTSVYLREKQNRGERQADALLEVLDLMRGCPSVCQRRAIGRTIFKTLISLRKGGSRGMNRGGTR